MSLDPADLPIERLKQRYDFLTNRAQAHLRAESPELRSPSLWREQACAATLMRDAGCIALLLGQPEQAAKNLLEAGYLLLKLGLPAGAALVLLGNPKQGSSTGAAFASLFTDSAWQRSRQEHLHRDDARALLPDATQEPRQMLGLSQAQLVAAAFNQPGLFGANGEGDDVQLRYRLERRGGYPAGITGLSIEAYLALADQLSTPHLIASKADFLEAPRSLELLFALRAEGIQTARKDRYHWNLVPRPAELVDLDSLILMLIALGHEGGGLIERALPAGAPALTDTPYRAAELLFQYHRDLPGL